MFSILRSRSKRPATRNRARRLYPETLETRRVLAGSIDVCFPVESFELADVPSEQWSPSEAKFGKNSAGHVVKPFRINGGGVLAFFPTIGGEAPHTIEGQATHLGQHEGLGWVRPFALADPDDPRLSPDAILAAEFDNSRPTVFEAANGDELHYDYGQAEGMFSPGIVQLFPDPDEPGKVFAVFIAEFTPIVGASTGRFANVVGGSFDMTATTESFALDDPENPPVDIAYSWSGSGTIEFSRGRR